MHHRERTTNREVFCRLFLLGRQFTVRTDHQALVWLFRLRDPSGRVAKWIEILSQYDFAIEYRPGREKGHCDALSRCENPSKCEYPDQDTYEPLKCGPCKKYVKRAQDKLVERAGKITGKHSRCKQQQRK